MAEVPLRGEREPPYLDLCTTCQFVWFDQQEYSDLPQLPKKEPPETTLPPEAKEAIARLEIETIKNKCRDGIEGDDAPDEDWKWIPAILGLPLESDAPPRSQIPIVTWLMVFLISVTSMIAFSDIGATANRFGLIPDHPLRYAGLTFITSFFLHGGVIHLLGNMYFLLVFGDNVEEWLGKRRFLLLVILSALSGDILHVLIGGPGSSIPCIGASGGISGIIAFYALTFPHVRLSFLLRIHSVMRWMSLPAYAMFFIWVTLQILGAMKQIAGFSNVSSVAHLGGAAIGFGFWLFTRYGDQSGIRVRSLARPAE